MNVHVPSVVRLGSLLLARGIPCQTLDRAIRLQDEDPRPLGEILIEMGACAETDILSAWAEQLGLRHLNALDDIDEASANSLGLEWLSERNAAPILLDGRLAVALADPSDRFILDELRARLGEFTPVLASREEIRKALEEHMRDHGIPMALEVAPPADDASVPTWIDHLLERAIEERASDIHVEALEDATRVRFRIDGVLYEVPAPARHLHGAVVSRLKVLSDLNIAERRVPQDGKFPRIIAGRSYDVRVSVMPTVYGEDAVLRLLERTGGLRLDDLGFSEAIRTALDKVSRRSHGMILATGPTGSGKTTTLYSLLQRLNDVTRKIITIEDPVEYDLPGVRQIQVNEKTGLTFARGLRSILRQDPDIVLVGEIRDPETAQIAIQAALTGHLVPTTLHTNDAPSSVVRLIDMGAERFLVASAVAGVLAQRLVRRICAECRAEIEIADEARSLFQGLGLDIPARLFKGRGCLACRGTGFRGRLAIGEFLVVDEAVREAIHRSDAGTPEIRRAAAKGGYRPMLVDGLARAAAGDTTVDEVLRVAVAEVE